MWDFNHSDIYSYEYFSPEKSKDFLISFRNGMNNINHMNRLNHMAGLEKPVEMKITNFGFTC